MRFGRRGLHLVMAPFMALASIAYIFRFPGPVGDLSLFRVALFVYAILATGKMLRSRSVTVWVEFIRIAIAGALIAAPTVIDVIFLTHDQTLIRVIYSFWANLLFWAAFSLVVDRGDFEYYLRWYCFVAILESAIAIYGYITMKFPLDFIISKYGTDYSKGLSVFNINDGFVRLTGTFFDPNFYGLYLVSIIAAAIWLYVYTGRHLFYLFVSMLSFLQLLLTASRTSLLALGGVIFVFAVYQGVAPWVILMACIALVIAGGGVVLLDPVLFEKLFAGESVTDRFAFFERGVNAFLNNPIFGGGSEAIIDPESGLSTAHSVYLSILGRNGLFGLACFILGIIIIMKPVVGKGGLGISSRHFVAQIFFLVAISFISYDTLYYFEPLYFLFAMMFVCMKAKAVSPRSVRIQDEGVR